MPRHDLPSQCSTNTLDAGHAWMAHSTPVAQPSAGPVAATPASWVTPCRVWKIRQPGETAVLAAAGNTEAAAVMMAKPGTTARRRIFLITGSSLSREVANYT